jgi:hypothetical protein
VGRAPRGAAARLLRRGGEASRLGEPGEDHPRHGHGHLLPPSLGTLLRARSDV